MDARDGVTLWIVGQLVNAANDKEWEIQGVFDSKARAIAACIHPSYFIGSVRLNEALPRETVPWTDAYYPQLQPDPAPCMQAAARLLDPAQKPRIVFKAILEPVLL